MTWAFWLAVALVFYTYAGYPCWLRLRMFWRSAPARRGPMEPFLSIAMVVRNEEQVLDSKLRNLMGLDYPADRCRIVVVSDGSTDRTEEILREYARDPRIQIVLNQLPQGKASGLNDAMALCEGDLVVFTDARQSIERSAVRLLAENFADPDVGCVSGELMLGDPMKGESGQGVGLYWRIEKRIRELESASGSVVGATGALYATRRDLLTPIPSGTILDDVYLPMQVVRQGKRVIFDDRAKAWDQPNLGTGREFSRKVRTLSGNYQLVQLAPWLLSGQNPIRFEFISHKLLRLVVPVALAALLLIPLALRTRFYLAVFAAQVIFYALSAVSLGQIVRGGLLARVADAAGTFVLLNTAAAVALANFLVGKRAAWR
ncbi:MAG TPA: glycosyltransferase family 2 protein [Candidatus Dormibacteraeota bacterium]|nr:glycosyltransferase family 2 protein [Candidatus Dormibacteraeota bacterium]